MHVKLPKKIGTCEELWQLLLDGRDVFERGPVTRQKVSITSHIDDALWSAAGQLGITDSEAELMDPQHRLLLEMSWECMKSVTQPGSDRITGVFASCNASSFFRDVMTYRPDEWERANMQLLEANQPELLATRIAYALDLTGPALYIGTACSSALVAVNLAIQAINSLQCDQALVAAACIASPWETGYAVLPGDIYSPDGFCRPFSDAANGTLPGNGAAVILLKRLDDAVADDDYIYAVIEGSAVNNDGRAKVGFAVPSVEGQVDCILTALDVAQVTASEVCYVEAHGAGTSVGDPVELRALSLAYGALDPGRERFVGSIKANIGHCDVAAGLFGLIKTALVLDRRILPPQINLGTPTTQHDWNDRDLHVAPVAVALDPHAGPDGGLIAGVNALGVGGTNAHVLLRNASSVVERITNRRPPLINRLTGRRKCGIQVRGSGLAIPATDIAPGR
jgi:acyl transferase domain-containing protein